MQDVSDQFHAPVALTPGNPPSVLVEQLDGRQSKNEGFGEEKNHLPLPENEPTPPSCPTCYLLW